ncbi:hypothetical protein M2651_10180 [Clostridium sp. SYSU_GA19001]|uniref:hypothetical protein n=1 Tax=Clostridium caldaquaticum TaxID=2940653 RepID=UPI0020772CC7|nr:hypothetical protein [Clostridium caldaquaticum]MCM8711387.1 hypothetical protein [Clostridium caldaquaticum]
MRRKRKNGFSKGIVLISLIVILSFIGICYAYWKEDINVSASINTGNMDVYFLSTADDLTYGSNVSISYEKDSNVSNSSNNNVMNVNLVMKKGGEIKVKYTTRNGGTVPIIPKLYQISVTPNSGGVGIVFSPGYYMFKPGANGWGTMTIRVYNSASLGKYNFNIVLPHKQYINSKDGKWQKNVVVKGIVEVVE